MKKLIVIFILFSITCQSQSIWQKIPDDVKHHYAAVIITDFTAGITYKLSKGKIGLSIFTGLAAGITATLLKEELIDRTLKKGVPSQEDKMNGVMGSGCGSFYWIVYIVPKHNRKIELENKFLDLNSIDIDRALADTTLRTSN